MITMLLAGLGDTQADAQYLFDRVSGNPALVSKPAYASYMPTINALMQKGDYSNALTYLNYLGAQASVSLPVGGVAPAAAGGGGIMSSIPWKKILIGGGAVLALALAVRWWKSRTKTTQS